MSRIIKPHDLNDIIRKYQAGATTTELSKEYGVQRQSILIRIKKAGVPTRTIAEVKAADLPPINIPTLITRYHQGRSINSLAKEIGVDRKAITQRLLAGGVKLRSQSDAETVKWSFMDAAHRKAQVAAANAAASIQFAGQRPTEQCLLAKCHSWQRNRFMSAAETSISTILTDLGIPHTPQFVVRSYNIDLAIDEMPVAVEVLAGYPSNTYGPKLRTRLEYLFSQGWHVLFIYMISGNRNDLSKVSKYLPSWLDRARRDKSVFGRYGVIRCDSKNGPILGAYLHGLPCVEAP